MVADGMVVDGEDESSKKLLIASPMSLIRSDIFSAKSVLSSSYSGLIQS